MKRIIAPTAIKAGLQGVGENDGAMSLFHRKRRVNQ